MIPAHRRDALSAPARWWAAFRVMTPLTEVNCLKVEKIGSVSSKNHTTDVGSLSPQALAMSAPLWKLQSEGRINTIQRVKGTRRKRKPDI